MTPEIFKQEIVFGLENLEKVKGDIARFHASRVETSLRSSAIDLEKLDEVVATVNDTHESFVALFHEITQKA